MIRKWYFAEQNVSHFYVAYPYIMSGESYIFSHHPDWGLDHHDLPVNHLYASVRCSDPVFGISFAPLISDLGSEALKENFYESNSDNTMEKFKDPAESNKGYQCSKPK